MGKRSSRHRLPVFPVLSTSKKSRKSLVDIIGQSIKMLKRSCPPQPAILTRKRKVEDIAVVQSIESPPPDILSFDQVSNANQFTTGEKYKNDDDDDDDDHDGGKTDRNDSGLSLASDERWPLDECPSTKSHRWFHHMTPQLSARHHNSPMPLVRWADRVKVWDVMIEKDNYYHQQKDPQYLGQHKGLQPRMRAIVMDWLIEVCEVYRLQRDTYMLAMDFFDRYLTRTKNIEKQHLQLIGITCLFLASKYEEIYPPKLDEFAYVTDGACSRDDILGQEIIMLKMLEWDASTLTVTDWLHMFLQLAGKRDLTSENLLIPNYSSHFFYQITQLIDLSMMDIACLRFPHRILAASALYHMSSLETLRTATNFEWADVWRCVSWMAPFATTLFTNGLSERKFFNEVEIEASHNIQVHLFDLSLYDKVIDRQNLINSQLCTPLASSSPPPIDVGILTPPKSNEKSNGDSLTDVRWANNQSSSNHQVG